MTIPLCGKDCGPCSYAEPAFRVVGESADGMETIALVERLRPSILIVDVMMPGLSGMEVTRRVTDSSPHTRVVILSIYAGEARMLEALKLGAAGHALKDVELADLIRGLHEVAAGRRYLSPPLSEHAIEAYAKRAAASEDVHEALTPREREILQLVAEATPVRRLQYAWASVRAPSKCTARREQGTG